MLAIGLLDSTRSVSVEKIQNRLGFDNDFGQEFIRVKKSYF